MNHGQEQILAEIKKLVINGVSIEDILVTENANGEHVWGEPTALEKDDMIEAMEHCQNCTVDGMRTGQEFCWAHDIDSDTIEIKNTEKYNA